jgi:hypothetical protein
VYLTDGVFLYRFVGLVANSAGHLVELEDCYLLDVVRVPITHFRSRDLRVVTPDARRATPPAVRSAPPFSFA